MAANWWPRSRAWKASDSQCKTDCSAIDLPNARWMATRASNHVRRLSVANDFDAPAEECTMDHRPPLRLVSESKICDLLVHDVPKGAFEASGVLAKDGKYFVVFDNRTSIARLSVSMRPDDMNGLFGMGLDEKGYEGIGYNAKKRRFYLLIESRKRPGGRLHDAQIVEYNDCFACLKARVMEFCFESGNKGFEALAHVRRNGRDYALALCEGNKCKGGRKGQKPGGGRIQLFEKGKKRWSHVGTIKLPKSVQFVDYSGMSIDDGRVAIVSQASSMLWIGEFDETTWEWCDNGRTYEFPRTANGEVVYGNVEGVAWITRSRIVTVSDRRKDDQPEWFEDKDQSIHVFDIPS